MIKVLTSVMDKKDSYLYIFFDLNEPGRYSFVGLNYSFLYKPFYIGKGIRDRYKAHKYDRSGSYKSNKLQKLLTRFNFEDLVQVVQKNLTNKEAGDLEIDHIKKIGRFMEGGPLTNLLEGGEGMSSSWMKIHNPMYNISSDQHSKNIKEKQWSGEKGAKRKKLLSRKMMGSKNPSSKIYLVIEPNGFRHFIRGLKPWCRNNNMSWNLIRTWVDKGPIKKTTIKDRSIFLPQKKKVLGWEIKNIQNLTFLKRNNNEDYN